MNVHLNVIKRKKGKNKMVNKTILIGNIGADPNIKYFDETPDENSKFVVNFNLATSERRKDKKTGEYKFETEWHKITAFGPKGKGNYCKVFKKGMQVYIMGHLRTKIRKNKDGSFKDKNTEIIVDEANILKQPKVDS